jgi:transcriptional regulator NrdR family protein
MKCPTCAAWSEVLDTRNGPHETTKRRRECGNGHRFYTFEMLAPARNPGTMQRAILAVQSRRARWVRNQAIQRNPGDLTRSELALQTGLTVSMIKDIQLRPGRKR